MLISWLRRFYAEHYEWALRFPVVRRIRIAEARLLRQVLASELGAGDTALEIGAGTGYYTLDIARRVSRVVALERSPEMAAVLRGRLARAGVANATVIERDFFACQPKERFDHVIALGVLDHIADSASFLARSAALARKRAIVTMPHRSLWNRLYTPIAFLGGIRVYTHSADELRRSLDGQLLRVEDVGLRTRLTSGFTLVVVVDCEARS